MKIVSLKEKVVDYRRQGYSYGMISEVTGLSKSTLGGWLKGIPFSPNQELINRIGLAKLKSAQSKNIKRIDDVEEMNKIAREEIGGLSKRDLWMLGIGIYLGEGSKLDENIRIINSDPKIIKAMIEWFKQICGLDTINFVPSVHLYPDSDIEKIINFWSKTTSIPKDQFGKTQIDKRENKSQKRKGKLPYGTLHLQIKSCGKKEFGRSLHRRIMGWLETSLTQI